jgi:hypothetical protein
VSRTGAFACQALFVGFCLFASLYCLLAYVPFTSQQFIKSEVFPALNITARLHPYLYWFILALAAPGIGVRWSRSSLSFWAAHLAAGIFFVVHPVLAHVESNGQGLKWAIALLVPVIWLGVVNWVYAFPRIRWQPKLAEQDRATFHAAWRTGLFVALSWAVIAVVRHPPSDWKQSSGLVGFAASLLTQELVWIFVFIVLNLLGVVASWFKSPACVQFILCHLLGGSMLYLVFRTIAFPALSFDGVESAVYSAGFSLAFTLFLSGAALRGVAKAKEEAASGLSMALWVPRRSHTGLAKLAATAIAFAALTGVTAVVLSRTDWNFLLQKTMVLITWVLVFRLFFSNASSKPFSPSPTGVLLSCALLILPVYRSWEAFKESAWKATGEKQTLQHFLDQWSGYDVSFKLLRDLMTRDTGDDTFYRFLTQNTNIPRSTYVAPVPVNAVDQLAYTAGQKPNIFMIVVDSLRRDYLSPYNSAVDFTPNIGRFANENVIMENAFTHYGATGLSEPSIWVGGMILHKQYVTPFAPMNALQKLLETEKYKALISRDTILQVIVPEWPALEELDKGRPNMDYDLCSSLDELGGRVSRQPKDARLFAYTQPQNIHISVINRAGAKPISNENYRAFYAPYASRLRRMDACFGSFIETLKAQGLYDSSIVILTADHGDSLGEQGRWGHAYSIYPEIVRIPMLIHVPPEMRRSLYVNPKGLAFSTDLTPTLYYLTGHKPANRGEIFGMPLFVERPEEQAGFRRKSYLIASSYGAVYGILSSDGSSLDVFDAVNYKDNSFDVGSLFGGESGLSTSKREADMKLVRQKVQDIDRFYGFKPPGS